MAKTISFKIKLEGSKDVLSQIDKIGKALTDKLKGANIKLDNKAFDDIAKSTEVLKNNVTKAGASIADMTKKLTQLRSEGKQNTVEYQNLTKQIATLKNQQAATNAEVKKSQATLQAQANLQKLLNGEIKAGALSQKEFFAALNSGLDKADPKYQELINDFAKLKQEEKGFRDGLRKQQQALQQVGAAAGSYRALNAELVQVRARYKELSAEERNGATGTAALARIKKLDTELKKLDKDVGQFQRNVGNYASAWRGVSGALSAIGVTAGLSGIANTVKGTINAFAEFEAQMAAVQIASGATDDQIKELEEDARRLGATTRFTAKEVAGLQENFARLGFSPDEIKAVTEATLELAITTGEDLPAAAEVAAGTLKGYRLQSDETARVTNVMALSFSRSALNLERFRESQKLVAPLAAELNVSVEAITASFGKLADNQILGSQAGTAQRKILSELGNENSKLSKFLGVSVKSTEDYALALNKLRDSNLDTATAQELVGDRAFTALLALKNNADGINQLTGELNNASTAYAKLKDGSIVPLTEELKASGKEYEVYSAGQRGAAIASDTLSGDLATLRSAVAEVGLKFGEATEGGLRGFLQGLTNAIPVLVDNIGLITKLSAAIALVLFRQQAANIATKAWAVITKAASIGTTLYSNVIGVLSGKIKLATIAQNLFNKASKANVVILITSAIIGLIAAISELAKRNETVRKSVEKFKSALSLLYGALEPIIDAFFSLGSTLIDAGKDLGVFDAIIKGLVGGINILTGIIKGLSRVASGTFSSISAIVKTTVSSMIKRLTGFKDILVGVFTLDLDQIKRGAAGVVDSYSDIGNAAADGFRDGFEKQMEKENKALEKSLARDVRRLAKNYSQEAADALLEELNKAQNSGKIGFQVNFDLGIEIDKARIFSELQEDVLDAVESKDKELISSLQKSINDAVESGALTNEQAGKLRDKLNQGFTPINDGLNDQVNNLKKIGDKALEARKKALENIRKLESSLVKNDFDGQIVQAESKAESDISGLVGDPEQIRKQTTLINSQLALSVSEIEQKRVASFASIIERAKKSAANEIALLTGSPNEIAIQSEVIKQSLVVQIEGITDDRNEAISNAIAQAEANKEAEIAALTGSPEEIEASASIIRQTYTQVVSDLTETRKAILAEDEREVNTLRRQIVNEYGGDIAEDLRTASLTELQIAKDTLEQKLTLLDEGLAREQSALNKVADLKKQQLAIKLQSGVTPARAQEIADELEAIDKKLKEDLLKSERDLAKKRLEAVKAVVPAALTEAERLAQAEVALNKDKNDAIIESNKAKNEKLIADDKARAEKQKQLEEELKGALVDAAFQIAGALADASIERERQQIEEQNRIEQEKIQSSGEAAKESTKAFYKTQIEEAEGNTEKQESLREELAAKLEEIDKGTAEKERVLRISTAEQEKALARKQALINGALAATKVLATNAFPLPAIPLLIAVAAGVAANIATINSQQFEKGGALSNGLESYIVQAYEEGGSVSAPDITGASKGIPVEGVIQGPRHKDGGVPATFNNTAIEAEGGEYKLRNGKETYIINRESTRIFKPQLDKLKGNPNKFDPAKRVAASNINSFRGKGVKFAAGGSLGVGAVASIPAPVGLQNINGSVTREELSKAVQGVYSGLSGIAKQLDTKTDIIAGEIMKETAAINKRIDRLKVYTDPADIVGKGNELLEAQTTFEL